LDFNVFGGTQTREIRMSVFIQSLESRTFLSASPVTKATLAMDEASIVADAANANAAFKTLVAELKIETAAIATDLKTLPKTNAPLLKTLKTDEATAEGTLKTDLALLLKPSAALAKKSTATGESLLTKATLKLVATAAAEIAALNTVTNPSAYVLQAALQASSPGINKVFYDLITLTNANPAATQLATDVATTKTDITNESGGYILPFSLLTASVGSDAVTQTGSISTNAMQLESDISTLATDLTSANTAVGTLPEMVGTFNGTAQTLKGRDKGETSDLTITITSEDAAGNLLGSLTDNGYGYSLSASITLNGKFAAKATSADNGNFTLLGQFSDGILTGTFKGPNSGTFSIAETI
jgi:hypothetical protein